MNDVEGVIIWPLRAGARLRAANRRGAANHKTLEGRTVVLQMSSRT